MTRAASIFRLSVERIADESMSDKGNQMATEMRNTPAKCAEGMSTTAMGSHAAEGTGPITFSNGANQ